MSPIFSRRSRQSDSAIIISFLGDGVDKIDIFHDGASGAGKRYLAVDGSGKEIAKWMIPYGFRRECRRNMVHSKHVEFVYKVREGGE